MLKIQRYTAMGLWSPDIRESPKGEYVEYREVQRVESKVQDIRDKLNGAMDTDEFDVLRETTLEALVELETVFGIPSPPYEQE